MRKLVPYIGICDFMNFEQVKAMLDVFNANLPAGVERKLHVGAMMSYKTLNGLPTKWEAVFPRKEDIATIFSSDETYNCLHYVADDMRDDRELWRNMAIAISPYGGIGIHAIQLDRVVWPDPLQIFNGIHTSRHDDDVEVILQISGVALDEVGNNPEELVERLRDYETVIHRVLLDKSMGQGLGLDAVGLLPFLSAIAESLPNLGLVVAGGIGPDTAHLIGPIVKEFPDISWDAQSKLHVDGHAMNPVDWDRATAYLENTLKLLAA